MSAWLKARRDTVARENGWRVPPWHKPGREHRYVEGNNGRWRLQCGDWSLKGAVAFEDVQRWVKWFNTLSDEEQDRYREHFDPEGSGYYDWSAREIAARKKRKEEFLARFYEHGEIMPAPWVQCPEIGRGSIGWRMGGGEDVWHEFWGWYRTLDEDRRAEVRAQYPEPDDDGHGHSWAGIYDMMEEAERKRR